MARACQVPLWGQTQQQEEQQRETGRERLLLRARECYFSSHSFCSSGILTLTTECGGVMQTKVACTPFPFPDPSQ